MLTIALVAGALGRPAARVLLYPICLYFVMSSGSASRAIARFRERALGRPTGWRELFWHYHVFASTILDRIYFLRARFDLFDIQFHGLDVLDRELAKGRGCVLLGAHVGSFEAVRAVGLLRRRLDIRVFMDEQNAPLIRGLTQELNPDVAETVIQAGGVQAMLQVKECLERGGIIGMMGDRVTQQDQTVKCRFSAVKPDFQPQRYAWPMLPGLRWSCFSGSTGERTGTRCGSNPLAVSAEAAVIAAHVDHVAQQVRRVESSDATLYMIGQGQAATNDELQQLLTRLAALSGGRAFFEADAAALNQVFADILEDLSNQYLLTYQPEEIIKDGRWRSIRVEVHGPDYQVRARQGYRPVRVR